MISHSVCVWKTGVKKLESIKDFILVTSNVGKLKDYNVVFKINPDAKNDM